MNGSASLIGAREAELILDCDRNMIRKLIKSGRLPARIEKKRRARRWVLKRSDVFALAAAGFRSSRRRPRKRRIYSTWERYFGAVPDGFKPIFRDGNSRNLAPENLCLIARAKLWKPVAKGQTYAPRGVQSGWTSEMISKLRRIYARHSNVEVAQSLRMSVSAVRRKAKQLNLSKSQTALAARLRQARAYPLGTEIEKPWGIVYLKVASTGPKQWRPKNHVIWERANHKDLPPGYRVIFKDGNKENFDPKNLLAMTLEEVSALSNLRFHSSPKELKDVARLTTKLRHEADRQLLGFRPRKSFQRRQSRMQPGSRPYRPWTEQMDKILIRDYPRRPRWEVARNIGATETALRCRARRLGLQRLPSAVMAEARARAMAKRIQAASA